VDGKGRGTDVLTDEEGKSVEVGGFLTGQIQVPVSPAETFYSRFGHYFPVLCFVGACFFGAWILSLRSK